MNRLKLWLFALLLIGAAGLSLLAVTGDLHARAIQLIDARLAAASARVAASQRALQGDAGAVAALAARDPALIHALADDGSARARRSRAAGDAVQESAAQQAARAAVAAAEPELGVSLPQGARFTAAQRSWLEARAEDPAADVATVAFLRDALDGKPRRGFLRAGGGLSWGAAIPAGAGILGVFVPVDAAWVDAVAAGSGVDLTIAAPGLPPVSSRPPGAEAIVKVAAAGPGVVRDAGRLAPVVIDAGGVKLGARTLLLASAPAYRVIALPLADVKDGALILSVATQPLLAPIVELQWLGLVGLALASVLALLFGLLLGSAQAPAEIPAELLSAADRIDRGDFDARAPALAGRLGTVAAALNRAAAAARAGSGSSESAPLTAPLPQAAAPEPSWVPSRASATPSPVPLSPVSPAAPLTPPRVQAAPDEPAPSLPPVLPSPTLRLDAAALGVPVRAAPAAFDPPAPSPAELLQTAARAAPPDEAVGEEEHWREVFREFMRVRAECGESTQGLTYERLRAKLESNRDALMAKYGCRSVRFQVYVKEGKTALKATPVR
jgi:hypothetical protein